LYYPVEKRTPKSVSISREEINLGCIRCSASLKARVDPAVEGVLHQSKDSTEQTTNRTQDNNYPPNKLEIDAKALGIGNSGD
jgi:hypothetical protein